MPAETSSAAVRPQAPPSLDRHLPGPLRRLSLFWRLQLLGWGGFGLVSYLSFSVYFDVYTPSELAFYETIRMAMACGLTLLIRPFYHRLWARSASFPTLSLASLLGSLAGGLGLLIGFRLLFMRWVNPYSRAGDISTYPKSIVDYSLIFLAWSALYFGIKHWRDLQAERQRLATALGRLAPHPSSEDPELSEDEESPLTAEDHVLLTTGQSSFFLKVRDIARIESEAPYSRVYSRDGKTSLVLKSLKQWQQRLPAAFVRVHRSTIVNVECVERIEAAAGSTAQVFLRNFDRPVTLSRRYARQLKDRF